MKQFEEMQRSINTIEDYLYTDVKPMELANELGYSTDHFLRYLKNTLECHLVLRDRYSLYFNRFVYRH